MKVSDLIMMLDDAHNKVGDVNVCVVSDNHVLSSHTILNVRDGEYISGQSRIEIVIN